MKNKKQSCDYIKKEIEFLDECILELHDEIQKHLDNRYRLVTIAAQLICEEDWSKEAIITNQKKAKEIINEIHRKPEE